MTQRKIIHLEGTELSPEVVLHRTIEKLDHIKSVYVLIEWDDESVDCDWSTQALSKIAFKNAVFNYRLNEMLKRNEGA